MTKAGNYTQIYIIYIYIYTCSYIHIYIYTCSYMFLYIYIYTCSYVYIYINTYIHTCSYIYIYICSCVYIYIYTHVHILVKQWVIHQKPVNLLRIFQVKSSKTLGSARHLAANKHSSAIGPLGRARRFTKASRQSPWCWWFQPWG